MESTVRTALAKSQKVKTAKSSVLSMEPSRQEVKVNKVVPKNKPEVVHKIESFGDGVETVMTKASDFNRSSTFVEDLKPKSKSTKKPTRTLESQSTCLKPTGSRVSLAPSNVSSKGQVQSGQKFAHALGSLPKYLSKNKTSGDASRPHTAVATGSLESSKTRRSGIGITQNSLNVDVDELKKVISDLKNVEDKLKQELATVSSKLNDEQNKNYRLEQLLEVRGEYIKALQEADEINKARLIVQIKEVDDLREKVTNAKTFKTAKNEEVKNLCNTLKNQEFQIQQLNKDLEGKDEKLNEYKIKLSAL